MLGIRISCVHFFGTDFQNLKSRFPFKATKLRNWYLIKEKMVLNFSNCALDKNSTQNKTRRPEDNGVIDPCNYLYLLKI